MANQHARAGSFDETPEAKDDAFSFTEDQLVALLNSDTLQLDVIASDLGGKAKALYSVADGINGNLDLLQADLLTSGASAWETLSSGDQVRMDDERSILTSPPRSQH